MDKKRPNYSVHHKIWRCNCSRANVQEECNKMLLDVMEHRWLNSLFHEKQCPQEQLEHLVNYIWKWTISREAQELFETLITMPREDFYQHNLIKKWKKKSNSR